MQNAPTLQRAFIGALSMILTGIANAGVPTCRADSAGAMPTVVELYTSEGCSSCPPADRWLSERVADPSLIAIAFHVDYWDRLGWKDRFADHAYTERQAREQKTSGARFSYTPQVIIDGRDRPDWWKLKTEIDARAATPASVELQLVHEGDRILATVRSQAKAPAHLGAYWAVTEDGYTSTVRAGENNGTTLHHDRVVRFYRPVDTWSGATAVRRLELDPAALPSTPGHARRVVLVITDADTGRPVQAVQLGC